MREKALRPYKDICACPGRRFEVRRNDGEKARHGEPSGFFISVGQMDIIFGIYSKYARRLMFEWLWRPFYIFCERSESRISNAVNAVKSFLNSATLAHIAVPP